jgi:adenylate cyclase class 2
MILEVEKKYRITKRQLASLVQKLSIAEYVGEDFEVNTLYRHPVLDLGDAILRLRKVGKSGLLTHKERIPRSSGIKHQKETETRVDNPDAMAEILATLGFTPALIYEKFRRTWRMNRVEIVIDRLPFGLFVEIEGSERAIKSAETKLSMEEFRVEHATYPQLTLKHGRRQGDLVTASFDTPVE